MSLGADEWLRPDGVCCHSARMDAAGRPLPANPVWIWPGRGRRVSRTNCNIHGPRVNYFRWPLNRWRHEFDRTTCEYYHENSSSRKFAWHIEDSKWNGSAMPGHGQEPQIDPQDLWLVVMQWPVGFDWVEGERVIREADEPWTAG